MLNLIEYLRTCTAEESAEITKTATKSLRFGLDDRHPHVQDSLTNREYMVNELNDLYQVVEMLVEQGVLPAEADSLPTKHRLTGLS